jgi:predicted DNA-binding transcriptional regulator AlpA
MQDKTRDLSISKVYRMKDLYNVTSAKPSTIYTWIRQGKFPKPKKMNRISVWSKDIIDNWMEEKLQS